MTRRPGLSLTEVLVALFLVAIGVIGVLTMFPVGAVQMGLALKDQRCAEAATQADAYMRWYWKSFIVEDPARAANESELWGGFGTGSPNNPSDPVVVDPMGRAAGRGSPIAGTTIDRARLMRLTNNDQVLRTCTLLDGFTYDQAGVPSQASGSIERENRYNWMWVLQRPKQRQRFTANMTIVVYDKRVHLFDQSMIEVSRTATINDGQTSVTLGSAIPALQRGGWLMDASTAGGTQLADFYRVASVDGTSVELATPARPPLGGGTRGTGRVVFFPGVAEVFERPPLTVRDAVP